jgi:hypothetical protein
MLSSAKEYKRLITTPGLDADRMQANYADVFRRMIWAQIHIGESTHLQEDFNQLITMAKTIKNIVDRRSLDDAITELEEPLGRLGIKRPDIVTADGVSAEL